MPRTRRLIGLQLALGLAAAALAVVPRAGADQAGPFTAGADAYVASNTPATNYNTRELRARNAGSQRVQSYLQFDLTGIPPWATNVRGTLRLHALAASQSGRVEVRTSDPFDEATVTWSTRPAVHAVQGSARVAPGRTYSIDAGPIAGNGLEQLALTAPSGQGAQLRFGSSEHADPAKRPALTVTYTAPPPVSDKLVPREGAWWGSYPGQAAGNVEAREALYGRQVDVLHRYHDWNDAWPTAEEQAYAAQGRFLFEGWENRVFGGGTVCWADVAGGAHDAAIDAQAQQGMYALLDAVGNAKPRMIGEYGSHDDPAMGSKEQWFRDVPAVLRLAMPKVKAVVYFDRVGAPVPGDPCNWIVDSSPQAQAGFAAAGADPYVNQPHG